MPQRQPALRLRPSGLPDTYVAHRANVDVGITVTRRSATVWQAQHDESKHVIVRGPSPARTLALLNAHLRTLESDFV